MMMAMMNEEDNGDDDACRLMKMNEDGDGDDGECK